MESVTQLGPLGKGSMGEVYRATDTSLNRQVAIKVLPTEFAQDSERLARFEREAKSLATLHHPNIAQIFGFEKSTGVHALVMELVEGPTLADRITQGAIPVLNIALGMRKREVAQRPAFWSSASGSNEHLELSRGLMRRDDRMHYDPDGEYFRAAHCRPAKQQNDDWVGSARLLCNVRSPRRNE